MKQKLTKTLAFFILIPLLFSACLKIERGDIYTPIVDPSSYSHLAIWKEIESKTKEGNWDTIMEGDTLLLFSNDADSLKSRRGSYIYKHHLSANEIDTRGFFVQNDGFLLLISKKISDEQSPLIYERSTGDAPTAEYKNLGDSLLLIKYISLDPAVEVKYQKIKRNR